MLTAVLTLMLSMADNASASLVAHYEFEGNANDNAGTNHGTEYGGPPYVGGVFGQALSFDGNDDYVDCGNDSALNITDEITVSAWVKTNGAANGQYNPYVTKGDAAYGLKYDPGNNIHFAVYAGAWHLALFPVDNSFNAVWQHLAGTYDGNDIRLYIDGRMEVSFAATGPIATNTYNLNIGRNSEVTNRLYDGAIDDVRIYNHALSEAEIAKLAATMGFVYQGRLMDANNPSDGLYDFEFKLYDAPGTGTQQGRAIDVNDLDVIEGYFTVELDFGTDPNIFNGDPRWLEIGVRPGDSGGYTILSPRQRITPTPYALYATSAASGTGIEIPLELSGSSLDPIIFHQQW